jgi:alpha-L-fucosidase
MLNQKQYEAAIGRTRARRMKWWTEARYGMFVHWGLYSLLGRHEWAQAYECIPPQEYEKLADRFRPKPRAPREWARLARDAGMKYLVLTTKHHEGFCLWRSQQTDFNAWTACGRDLVAEYVDACREFGLRIGFYYSLMDWRHPDGGRAARDPAARRRFVEFTHGCVRELMSNYGKIDILWYDVPEPMATPEEWQSLALNQMVRSLQPQILINNRSRLDEDFSTPENSVTAPQGGRAWEACMTFNHAAWGYMPSAAGDSHSPREIVKMLSVACWDAGNLLLNIGPTPDGSVPPEAVGPLRTVGRWLRVNGEAVYGRLNPDTPRRAGACAGAAGGGGWSRKGRTVYCWVRFWPGRELGIGGFQTRLKSARFLATGRKIAFQQKGPRIVLRNLPQRSPDKLCGVTVIVLEFASAPHHKSFAGIPALAECRLGQSKAPPKKGRMQHAGI